MPSIIQTVCPEKLSFASTVPEYFSRPHIFLTHSHIRNTIRTFAPALFFFFFFFKKLDHNARIISQLCTLYSPYRHYAFMSNRWQTFNGVKHVYQYHILTPVETKKANVRIYNFRFMLCSCLNFNVVNTRWLHDKHIFIKIQMFCLSWCYVTHSMATVRNNCHLRSTAIAHDLMLYQTLRVPLSGNKFNKKA